MKDTTLGQLGFHGEALGATITGTLIRALDYLRAIGDRIFG